MFSALDVTTAVHVYNHCFCSDLLHGRTTILVTQLPWIGEQADFEVKLDEGQVRIAETRIDVVRVAVNVCQVLSNSEQGMTVDFDGRVPSINSAEQSVASAPSSDSSRAQESSGHRDAKALGKFVFR